jgi:hypothetical protein
MLFTLLLYAFIYLKTKLYLETLQSFHTHTEKKNSGHRTFFSDGEIMLSAIYEVSLMDNSSTYPGIKVFISHRKYLKNMNL